MKKNRKHSPDQTSQVYDSDTYCPSVQRALFKECKLEELLAESELKKAGMKTAETLIQMLYEQIKSIKGQKQTLQLQINCMLRQFSQKEEHLKLQISFLDAQLKQAMQISELKAAQMRDINSGSSLSKCFLPSSSRKIAVPKSHKSIQKRNEKSKYYESPIRKMSLIETVSKQYVDYGCERESKVCQEAVSALLSDDVERLVVDFQGISELLKEEKVQLMEYVKKLEENGQKVKQVSKQLRIPVEEELGSYQKTQVRTRQESGSKSIGKKQPMRSRQLFTTQNSNQKSPHKAQLISSWQDKIKQQSKAGSSVKDMMNEYQEIIQHYKEYSAYLRAYLCSCISFIAKSAEEMAQNGGVYCLQSERVKNSQESECLSTDRSNNLVSFPSNRVFEVVLRDILASVEEKVQVEHSVRKELEEENWELRAILDELVENLKKSGIKASPKGNLIRETHKIDSPKAFSPNQTPTNKHSSNQNEYSSYKKSNHPQYKSNKAPQLHRITLTQYKRYHNCQE